MIRSIFANFTARLSVAAMNFFMLLLTTHALGKEVRGEISIIQLSISIVHLISDIVGGPALVYLVPRAKRSTLYIAGWLWAAFSCLAIGSILIQSGLMPEKFGVEVLVASLLLSLHSVNMNILLGEQRIREYNMLLLLQGIMLFATMAFSIFVMDRTGAVPYLDACFVAYGLCWAVGFLLVLRKKHEPALEESRPILFVLFANGFFTQVATLTHQLSIRENYYHLDRLIDDNKGSVGIYSTAISLAEAILLFSASVAAVLMARVSNEGIESVSRIRTLRLSKLSLGITVPGVLMFVLLPEEFYSWLLGKDFHPVRQAFIVLTPGILAVSFGTVFSHYFSGTGRHYLNFLSGTLALSVTFLSAEPLISALGVNGAAWSATLAYGTLSLFIFLVFMFGKNRTAEEWKALLPSRSDWVAVLTLFKRNKTTE